MLATVRGVEAIPPKIHNMKTNTVLWNDLALLHGKCDRSASSIHVTQTCKSGAQNTSEWPVLNGAFKILAELEPGQNDFLLTASDRSSRFACTYEPLRNRRTVRFVYVLAADSDGMSRSIRQS